MLAAQVGLQAQLATQQAQSAATNVPEWKRKLIEKKLAKEQPALSYALASRAEAERPHDGPLPMPTPKKK
jgi:hypothetical protein